jgi:murein DD-endopeptidase MepM/ murein hydrolase activator NlpD
VVLTGTLLFLGNCLHLRYSLEKQLALEAYLARQQVAALQAQLTRFTELAVPSGRNITDCLLRMGLARDTVFAVVEAARPVYDLARLHAGHSLTVGAALDGTLRVIRYQIDAERFLSILPRGDDFHAEIQTIPTQMETVRVSGRIEDSLFNAVADVGESPELALRLADIFGWDLDFYTDPRRGDTFRAAIERKTKRNGELLAYGKLLAAEYVNAGRSYQAVLFREPDGRAAYYTPDGKSLQKAFLRSPLKFSAPVTSRFSRSRFHPILKTHRPHLGIDYGAPLGAPVQSIGDGKVIFAGRSSGAGNMVHIRHANGYETQYLHLSRILVRTGERVRQGQRIGLVGATGLATGPHLDFRIRQHGQYRNFEALRLPPANPVPKHLWMEFVAARDAVMPLLTGEGVQWAQAAKRGNEEMRK